MKKTILPKSIPSGFLHESNRLDCRIFLTGCNELETYTVGSQFVTVLRSRTFGVNRIVVKRVLFKLFKLR